MPKEQPEMRKLKHVDASGAISFLFLAMLVLGAVPACAQESQELLATISQQVGRSMQSLTGYSFQRRTEVQVDGDTKSVQLVQVAFGPDRQPLVTPIGAPPPEDTGFGLRGLIEKRKAEEMKEEVRNLVQLSNSYLVPSQVEMQQLFGQAQVFVNPDSGVVRVDVSDLLQMGDHVTMNCDGLTKNRTQTQVRTFTNGNPVTINAVYQTLPTGLNYNAQTVINVPANGLQITINTMNYQQQAVPVASTPSVAQDPGWPRQWTNQGNTLVVYQPQVDDWKDFSVLDLRMAFSITPAGGRTAVGVMVLTGDTQVDNENQMVLISNLKIVSTHYPSLSPSETEPLDRLVRTFLPPTVNVSLHRLVASVPKKESVPGVQLRNDPPVIFVSYKPAILLDVDGRPVRAPVRKTSLEYVVNTHWPLFFDPGGSMFYLLVDRQWLKAATPDGPWLVTTKLPREMSRLRDDPQWADLEQSIPPPPAVPGAVVPIVFYSAVPADILLFDGKPSYARIPGTQLAYATNTLSYVFLHTPTNRYYYLTAGRWFGADSLGGPWKFATPDLPADFARIPPTSPAAQVLASVPGTEEAKDAVLMAQIPTTVIVNPAAAAARAKATYDGVAPVRADRGDIDVVRHEFHANGHPGR